MPRSVEVPEYDVHDTVGLDPSRTALIVVDMQNDFCHPDGWLASIGVDVALARAPIAPLSRLLPALRGADVPVLWVNWGARPDRANLSPALRHVYDRAGAGRGLGDPGPMGAPTLTEGSWGAAIVDELVPEPGDIRVSKHRMSGFWDTPLDAILRGIDVTTLLFAGVNADQCVLHTLADANFLGYDTLLVEDCAATTSPVLISTTAPATRSRNRGAPSPQRAIPTLTQADSRPARAGRVPSIGSTTSTTSGGSGPGGTTRPWSSE